jgi:hypothetical protein
MPLYGQITLNRQSAYAHIRAFSGVTYRLDCGFCAFGTLACATQREKSRSAASKGKVRIEFRPVKV